MRSHFSLSRGAAVACAVSGATSLITGVCSAQPFLAADYATDSAYATWDSGDNGGFGFTAWSLSGSSFAMNGASSFNQLGMAWTMYNPTASDMATATRGLAAPLQVGQTISTVFDSPTEIGYWRGITVGLLSSGTERLALWQFGIGWNTPTPPYAGGNNLGRWQAGDGHMTPLTATDTSAGVQLDIGLTGPDSYSLTMTPLGNPSLAYTETGLLANSGDINQIKFTFYNNASGVASPTDFYISSITIVPEPSTVALLGLGGLLFLRRRR